VDNYARDPITNPHPSFTIALQAFRSLQNVRVDEEMNWEGMSYRYDYEESEELDNGLGLDSLFSLGTSGLDGDDFDLGAITEHFSDCGIDPIGMMTKFSLAEIDAEQDQNSIWPILLDLKEDDEDVCSEEEMLSVASAGQELWECASYSGDLDSTLIESDFTLIQNDCEEFSKLIEIESPFDVDGEKFYTDKAFAISGRKCLQSMLGDNVAGNYIRHVYNNMDQVIQCMVEFGEKLPKCVLTSQDQVNSIGGDKITLPLSLDKKIFCLVKSYENIFVDSICTTLYEGLDNCLPDVGDDFDSDSVSLSCLENDVPIGKQDMLFGMDTSVITENKVPDFCSQVFEQSDMDIIQLNHRLDYFNKEREYGWVADSYDASSEDAVQGASPPDWENGEILEIEAKRTSNSYLVGGSAAAIGLALLFAAKSMRRGNNYLRLNAGGENEMV